MKTALVAEFGDEVLAEPGDDGFEIAAYLIPLGVLLGAAGAIAVGVRRWRRRADRRSEHRERGRARLQAARRRPRAVRPVILLAADSVDTTVFAAFGVGIVSFLSPCVLPLVPGYLSAISGLEFAEIEAGKSRLRVLLPAIIFCLSFSAMFVALGMTATGLGETLGENRVDAARGLGRPAHR